MSATSPRGASVAGEQSQHPAWAELPAQLTAAQGPSAQPAFSTDLTEGVWGCLANHTARPHNPSSPLPALK